MQLIPITTSIIKNVDNLFEVVLTGLKKNEVKVVEGDILVISSKILALTQGRIIELKRIKPSARAKALNKTQYGLAREDERFVQLVLDEADAVLPGKMLLTLKDGILIPSAGIDRSNAPEGFAILWPEDPWNVAQKLLRSFCAHFHLKKLGVIICDSHCTPLRLGVTGIAIAWAGFFGIEDARGTKDIFGKKLKVTQKAVADNLSSAALVLMGEAAEKTPFVLIKNAPVKFTDKMQKRSEVYFDPENCLFRGIYNKNTISKFISSHHEKTESPR